MPKEDTFKLTKQPDGELKVKHNKHKTVSPYNSVKHLKYANLPALCNDCIYRHVDEGGNGKCPKWEKDAACAIRADFKKFLAQIDTRKPDDLRALLDFLAKESFENVMLCLAQQKMDGNVPDRNTKSEINSFLTVIKTAAELADKIIVTEKVEFNKDSDIDTIFRQIEAKKSGSS